MDLYAICTLYVFLKVTLQSEPSVPLEKQTAGIWLFMIHLGTHVVAGINLAKHPERLVGRSTRKLGLREISLHELT